MIKKDGFNYIKKIIKKSYKNNKIKKLKKNNQFNNQII